MCGYYHEIHAEQERILEGFPVLSQKELDAVDKLHEAFLIYEDNGKKGSKWRREMWTTCCHQHQVLGPEPLRTSTSELRALYWAQHNFTMKCPCCGRRMTAKNRKKIRNWNGYEAYEPVLFIHVSEDGRTVWAQGYWTTKDLKKDLTGPVLYGVTRLYRFRPGEVMAWESGYSSGMHPCTDFWVKEPFQHGGIYSENAAYHVIGYERLSKSFLRYTEYDTPLDHEELSLKSYMGKRKELMRYLATAARYPRQVEMLRKMDCDSLVRDMVLNKRKNAAAFNWKETDPKKAFGLNGQELKAFLQTNRDIFTVELYKKFKKQGKGITMQEAAAYGEHFYRKSFARVCQQAAQWQLEPLRLLRYFLKQAEDKKHTVERVWDTWEGYVQAAQELGYELYKEKVLLPADLWGAHETATEENRLRHQQKREKELRERAAKEAEAYEGTRQKLELRYGVSIDGFVIRAPRDRIEIVNEGLILKHCVGGYADRHMSGTTTILFMRPEDKPDEPFLTIEMDGPHMRQIHGYKNEGLYTSKGRFAPDPREVYKETLDRWLKWVETGSRRDKQGRALLPKKKEVHIA